MSQRPACLWNWMSLRPAPWNGPPRRRPAFRYSDHRLAMSVPPTVRPAASHAWNSASVLSVRSAARGAGKASRFQPSPQSGPALKIRAVGENAWRSRVKSGTRPPLLSKAE